MATLDLFDRATAARAGTPFETFDLEDLTDLGPPQQARAGNPRQVMLAPGGPLTILDRTGAARAAPSKAATLTLAVPGAPGNPLPPFKVEIDADPNVGGLFVLDSSLLDSTDVLAPDVRYVALPGDEVISCATHRGRARDDSANDAGTLTIELDAWSGAYDPDNPSSPYQYNGELLLRQGMRVRWSVTIGGVDHVLFTGALESTAAGYGRQPTMTWTCVDLLARLGNAAFPPSTDFIRGGDTSEARVAWLLQYDAAFADAIVTGGGRVLVATQGGGTVLSNLEDVARSEWGRVYADLNNILVVTHHADDYAHTTDLIISDSAVGAPLMGWGEGGWGEGGWGGAVNTPLEPDDLTVDPGLSQVVNKAILTRPVSSVAPEGGVEPVEVVFTAEDPGTSIERFGRRTVEAAILLGNDSEAQALAVYLASRRAQPATHLASVSTSLGGASDDAMAAAADLDLGGWVRVERTTADGRALTWLVSAEGIDHTATTSGWSLALATAPLDGATLFGSSGWFILDSSVLDGTNVLAAY